MRGLPFTANVRDVNLFFANYPIIESSIKFGKNSEGTLTGYGACLFETETAAIQAFN